MTKVTDPEQGGRVCFAGIDAGGTSFKILMTDADGAILAEGSVPTSSPSETIMRCASFIQTKCEAEGYCLKKVGISSFGPLDVDPASKSYGSILKTPKKGWSQTNILTSFGLALDVPVAIDTDVNAALLAEQIKGAALGCSSAAYVTVGTGIGVGVRSGGNLIGKPMHPELGHMRVKRPPNDLDYPGCCPFHGDCLEGLASAPAIWERFGDPAKLGPSDVGTGVVAYYLAQLCLTIVLLARVERVILGGGVMQNRAILEATQTTFSELMNDYIPVADGVISAAGLGSRAGAWGGILLAQQNT